MTQTERGQLVDFCRRFLNPKSETFRQLAPSLEAAGFSPEQIEVKTRSRAWLYKLLDEYAERSVLAVQEIDTAWVADQLVKEAAGHRAQDRIRALELIGKWKGMFVDRMELTEGKKLIVIDGDSEDQGSPALLGEAGAGPGQDEKP